MKILLLLLCASLANAQMPDIKIGRCAGSNPILIWGGGGPDFGEFQLVVGDGPCDGAYFKVFYMDAESILCITSYWSINGKKETWKSEFIDSGKSSKFNVAGTFYNLEKGDVINFRYLVTRKKLDKA